MKGGGKGPCKFSSACTRPGCWFDHPLDRDTAAAAADPASTVRTPVLCRFGAACHRVGCRFSHPEGHDPSTVNPVACRYGSSCTRADCKFLHSPNVDHRAGKETVSEGAPENRVCVWFQKGRCQNGTLCRFQHVQQERDGNVIVVRNLPTSAAPAALHKQILEHFSSFGYISRILVKTDLDDRCRGFAFVVFSDALAAGEALHSKHHDWEIHLKTDLPMYIEGIEQGTRSTAEKARRDVNVPLRFPFGPGDEVLVIGDGDFSYTSVAVDLRFLNPLKVVATDIQAPRNTTHVQSLTSKGAQCRFDVDAATVLLEKTFDVVVYNFPHSGKPGIEATVEHLKSFFRSVPRVLRKGGIVAVTVKQTWPYSEWNVESHALSAGFQVLTTYTFPAKALRERGYTHTTTDRIPHNVDYIETAKTFEFVLDAGPEFQ